MKKFIILASVVSMISLISTVSIKADGGSGGISCWSIQLPPDGCCSTEPTPTT